MKAVSIFKLSLVLLLLISCSTEVTDIITSPTSRNQEVYSFSIVPGQTPVPSSIKSVQINKKGSLHTIPILKLGSQDRLIVSFDELSSIAGQFIVRFSHHNQDWTTSNQPDIFLYDGFNEFTIQSSQMNTENRPAYHTYSFEFPNREVRFKQSGNYLVHIIDFQSGTELFSLPFFVSEDEGELFIQSETIFNSGALNSAQDEILGFYNYPEFIQFPQIDLSINMYQNRFWNERKIPKEVDMSEDNIFGFRLSRDQLFPAYFDFNLLELETLSQQNPQIFSYQPSQNIPEAILRDDVLNFSSEPRLSFSNNLGNINQRGRYVNTMFRFNDGGALSNDTNIYLIGDFNQWTVDDRFKLTFNEELKVFEQKVLLKRGSYQYKYLEIKNGEAIELSLNDSISRNSQEYSVFIYYRDPQYLYDRILSVGQLLADN